MEKKEERKIVGRRTRPAKAPLSREAIVMTALDLLQKEGLDGLSLRKVAKVLDTGPASLYVYVENQADLYWRMLEHVIGEVHLPGPDEGDWRQRLIIMLNSYMDMLQKHAGMAFIAMHTISAGDNSLRSLDTVLELLMEGGADIQSASWGADMLSLYVTAIAAEDYNRTHLGEPLGRVRAALEAVSPEQYPTLYQARHALLAGDGPERFAWALNMLINGIVLNTKLMP